MNSLLIQKIIRRKRRVGGERNQEINSLYKAIYTKTENTILKFLYLVITIFSYK